MKKGLWSEHFSTTEERPLARYQRCLICPMCNAASCRLFTSSTSANPGRQFYICPAHDHKFFKWADKVNPDEFIDVPYCGGCSAGVCRVRKETSGPNAGRILFMCRVKEGEGSCGYRVWQDELQMSAMGQADETTTSFQSTKTNCDDIGPKNPAVVDESRQGDEVVDNESPAVDTSQDLQCQMSAMGQADETIHDIGPKNPAVVDKSRQGDEVVDNESPAVDTSQDLQCLGVTSGKIEQLKFQEEKRNESSRRPPKRSQYGELKAPGSLVSANSLTSHLAINSLSIKHCWMEAAIRQSLSSQLKGWWGRLAFHPMPSLMAHASRPFTYSVSSALDSNFVVQEDKILVNSADSAALTRSSLGAESYSKPLYVGCNAKLSGITPFCDALDVPSCSDPFYGTRIHNVMSKSISKAFSQAAENLQNDLLTLLETMNVKDHEAMSREAEATFAALDRLLVDHQVFEDRAEELIRCATSLDQIEQSMTTTDSYQKLVDVCSSERMRLDDISCVHAKVLDNVTDNKKRLKALQEDINSTKDWLFQIETEVLCCEVEMRNMEQELEEISKNKEALGGKFLLIFKELEESQKLLERKKAEHNAAKAAFDRARSLLRG